MENFDSWSESSSEFGGSEEFTPREEEVGLVNDVEEVDFVLPQSSEFGRDEEFTARDEREEEVDPLVIEGGVDDGLVEPSKLGGNEELTARCSPLESNVKCVNFYRKSPEDVQIHLLRHEIMQSYTIWHEHGEPHESNDVRRHEMRDGDLGGIDALVEDRIRGEPLDATQHEEVQNFDKLLNDAQREIYLGSKDYNLLKFVIEVNWLRANKSTEATDELWSLANGPNLLVKEHYGCITNGFRFHTREVDDRHRSQNSGVFAHGDHEGKIHNCYGHMIKVWEFEYMCQKIVLLFQCEWYNIGNTEVGDGEPLDPPECTDAFQQESMTSEVPIDIEDNIRFRREDAEVEVITGVGPLHETIENLTDDEVDEEHEIIGEDINDEAGEDHEISDADMDYDA
ncbi:hypothetical protein RHGRI_031043 [Rhododendron griersonianum]|uniref:DUF4216 domain-containing protein n=1 Tax=Rhododendron griersonianum TaxID=479676 RepID=A0AAV6I9R6_9ERIC|nr:hypothetical protein RHGRI_031043 [Rhododendron griersonianum]